MNGAPWPPPSAPSAGLADYAQDADPSREAAWIAELDGGRVGCVFCVDAGGRTAQLRILLVHPSARGHGLGTRLTPLAAARRIYLAEGFRLVEEEPHTSFGAELVGQVYERTLPG